MLWVPSASLRLPVSSNVMRLQSPPNSIELQITEVAPPTLPSAGDVRLEVKASIGAFAGVGSCWIEAQELKSFSVAAHQLYSSLQGTAQLKSMSPGEFSLLLSPAYSRGYVLVQVAIAKRYPVQGSMSGTFEVELPSLTHLAAWAENPSADA